MSKLANQVALVTGGSRGIGAATATRLAADGAAGVEAIERAGGKALAIQADCSSAEAVIGARRRLT